MPKFVFLVQVAKIGQALSVTPFNTAPTIWSEIRNLLAKQRQKYNLQKMNKASVLISGIVISFCLGFAFKATITNQTNSATPKMKKVTGIGGIFFKCKDPKKMNEWYKTHLGLDTNQYGVNFEWRQDADPSKKGSTQWSPFAETTTYFEPSPKDFMINYRVENLEALVAQLRKEGVTIVDKIESFDYGKFVHIIDLECNKIELWEPKDS